jgi:hypothetical protein
MAMPEWDKDVFISGSREGTINTFEIKISKEYFAEQQYSDLNSIAYMLYLGYDSSQDKATGELWYRWDNTAAAVNALRADGYTDSSFWAYQYMKFVEEYDPITTRASASVRLSSTNNGLRFKSDVDTDMLEYFKDKYAEVQIGTLIAPTDILGSNKLTHEFGVLNRDYIDVIADVDTPFEADKNGVTVYAGSISNINPKNLTRDFTAVGYVKLTDDEGAVTYYYSKTAATRNVSDVATLAYFDVVKEAQSGYTNLITRDNDVLKGYYSPYTNEQREILASLIYSNDEKDPGESDIF